MPTSLLGKRSCSRTSRRNRIRSRELVGNAAQYIPSQQDTSGRSQGVHEDIGPSLRKITASVAPRVRTGLSQMVGGWRVSLSCCACLPACPWNTLMHVFQGVCAVVLLSLPCADLAFLRTVTSIRGYAARRRAPAAGGQDPGKAGQLVCVPLHAGWRKGQPGRIASAAYTSDCACSTATGATSIYPIPTFVLR